MPHVRHQEELSLQCMSSRDENDQGSIEVSFTISVGVEQLIGPSGKTLAGTEHERWQKKQSNNGAHVDCQLRKESLYLVTRKTCSKKTKAAKIRAQR